MNKKLIATAIAAALVAPSAFAAEGADGMTYTSASEGFYGSLRVKYDTGNIEDDEASFTDDTPSRVGVRGTLDLGNNLTGFYQWEINVGQDDQGAAPGKRIGTVGMRGGFGEVQFGSFTDITHGLVTGRTDVMNDGAGNFGLHGGYRVDNAAAYSTPDLNGFQARARIIADGEMDNSVNDWVVGATYAVQGFDVGVLYRTDVDGSVSAAADTNGDGDMDDPGEGMSTADRDLWGIGAGYGQDNWNVAMWYGEQESTNGRTDVDNEILSIGGNVTVGKTQVYAFTETSENHGGVDGTDDTVSGVGVMYAFTTQSRVWLDYQANDRDSVANNAPGSDDKVSIGLRYDF